VAALDLNAPSTIHYEVFPKRVRRTAIVVAIVLHIVAIAILMRLETVRRAVADAAPIMVRLVTPEPKEIKPEEPPKPKPVQKQVQRPKPLPPPPVVTAPVEAPSPLVAPPPVPVPLPPIEQPPVATAPVETAPAAPPAPPAPLPEPVVPPVFNADYLNNPPPAYPAASRRMGEQGRVVLRVFVSEEGLPSQVQVRTPSGFSRLDEAALETVKHWRFVPARRGKTPVAAWVLVPISFSLKS
jgi:protein TonB